MVETVECVPATFARPGVLHPLTQQVSIYQCVANPLTQYLPYFQVIITATRPPTIMYLSDPHFPSSVRSSQSGQVI